MTDRTILELSLASVPSSGQKSFDKLRRLLSLIPENFCAEALQERCFGSRQEAKFIRVTYQPAHATHFQGGTPCQNSIS